MADIRRPISGRLLSSSVKLDAPIGQITHRASSASECPRAPAAEPGTPGRPSTVRYAERSMADKPWCSAHALETIHKLRTILYPIGKLIECLIGFS
jgi:hypothetical protein